jgi:Leucine-rich repeat (LRR) protein
MFCPHSIALIMDLNPPLEGPLVKPAGKTGRVIGALVLIAAAVGIAFFIRQKRHQREMAAAHEIGALGALVVMDAAGSHVSSINLSTIPTPESLTKAVELLPALGYATSLDASRTKLGDEHLAAVGQLSQLTTLAINETDVTDQALARLSGLTNLQALYLAKTAVSNDGVDSLAKLTGLHILDLSATKVTDHLEPLTKLPQLEWLLLRETNLQDSALPELAGCAKLSRLSLEGAKHSADSLAQLKKALPSLAVDLASTEPSEASTEPSEASAEPSEAPAEPSE